MEILTSDRMRVPLGSEEGSIPVEFVYTHGRAGERFFRLLKDEGKLLGARCPRCKHLRIPPRTYCEPCFVAVPEGNWEEVALKGRLEAVCAASRAHDGGALAEPQWIGFVRLDGCEGGFLTRLASTRKGYRVGDRVVGEVLPVAERKGLLTDIKYFRPA